MRSISTPAPLLALPSVRTLGHLVLGGAAGLGIWEVFASTVTPWLAGFPLQPPELVKALFVHQFGLAIADPLAALLHGLTGLLFYPIGYLLLSRAVPGFGVSTAGLIWGVITYVIALAVFAPLGGQAFLLSDVPLLSFMSLVGHAIYGFVAAIVFDRLETAS